MFSLLRLLRRPVSLIASLKPAVGPGQTSGVGVISRAFAAPPHRSGGVGGGQRPPGGGGGSGGGGGGGKGSGGGSRRPERIPRPVANRAIKHDPVRVIDKSGNHVGVVPLAEALALAKAANADLILAVADAEPPVCRIKSIKEHMSDLEQAVLDKKRAQKRSEPKGVRLTARTDVHDLGVKASKVVEFLRDKRPVMVTVSLTPQHMIREEPGRRGVLAKVVQAVAASGVGVCDPASVKGMGVNLQALFTPCASPKTAADAAAKVLQVLESPIRPAPKRPAPGSSSAGGPSVAGGDDNDEEEEEEGGEEDDDDDDDATGLALPPEVKLAALAQAKPTTVPLDRLLPSPAALNSMRRRVARASPAGGGADLDGDDDSGRAGRRERGGDDDDVGEGGRRSSDDVFPKPKLVAKRAPPSAGFAPPGLKRKPASRAGGGKGGPGKRRH